MDLRPHAPSEHFLRGQRTSQKPARRIGRMMVRRLVLLLVLSSVAVLAAWTATVAGRAPELAVNRIWVQGNERLSQGEILGLLELDRQYNTLTLDLDEVRRKLLRSAWVRDVELTRVLPATLTLDIEERTPSAVAVLDELYLLAGDGTILDQLSPQYDISKLVVVRGLLGPEGALVEERAALAGRLSTRLASDERLAPLVSELDVAGGVGSVSVLLRVPQLSILVTEDGMIERLHELVPLLDGLRTRFPVLELVDLRFSGKVYLRSGPSAQGEAPASARFAPGGESF